MATEKKTLLRYDDQQTDRSLVVEDDGRVAFAYLLIAEKIVSNAWLYNVAEAPKTAPWLDGLQIPCLNPREFCAGGTVTRLSDARSVRFVWSPEGVDLMLNDHLVARLEKGCKPGWSKFAAKSGPLAKPLVT